MPTAAKISGGPIVRLHVKMVENATDKTVNAKIPFDLVPIQRRAALSIA